MYTVEQKQTVDVLHQVSSFVQLASECIVHLLCKVQILVLPLYNNHSRRMHLHERLLPILAHLSLLPSRKFRIRRLQ